MTYSENNNNNPIQFPVTVTAYAVKEGGGFKEVQFTVGSLGDYECFIAIESVGICHTDFFTFSTPGAIPGHEMVGTVRAVGSKVTNVHVGQRVGAGCLAESCLHCNMCNRGYEQLCADKKFFMDIGKGGYANGLVWDARFVFAIPENIPSDEAGPLLCAGCTVYTAIKIHSGLQGQGKRLAVLGLGGLGHLALQFAKTMGYHVIALSTSHNKEEESRKFGADEFVIHTEADQMEKLKDSVDFILNTVSGDVNWDACLSLLAPLGKLCLVGVPENNIQLRALPLLAKNASLCGSLVSGRDDMNEMLKFASDYNVRPKVEVFPMSQVEKAIDKVAKNTARYRMVLKTEKTL